MTRASPGRRSFQDDARHDSLNHDLLHSDRSTSTHVLNPVFSSLRPTRGPWRVFGNPEIRARR